MAIKNDIGWHFDHSFTKLEPHFYVRLSPTPVKEPKLVILNTALMDDLGLHADGVSDDTFAQIFAGNVLPQGADTIAQAYAGHQFGHFAMLGDGRAHLIGEHITPDGNRFDIQLKGSGKTPYSRGGDGRAALAPMLREYIISEAMHALNIPSTRSLAVVTTGESVYRETPLQGAILTRVASSHLRVGTFEYVAARGDIKGLRQLADYTINRHYSDIKDLSSPYVALIKAVMSRQVKLIVQWLRVGFIHGVLNTDNVAISGDTIDYGPCAFMDTYNPQTVFSSIDRYGRYAYANQLHIGQWNIARFAESILPLLHNDIKQAASHAEDIVESFTEQCQEAWLDMMCQKLGLLARVGDDEKLIGDLLAWMQRNHMDYTNTFYDLISEKIPQGKSYQSAEFRAWWQRWQQRLEKNERPLASALRVMKKNNPAIIPRNHKVEEVLAAAEERSDFSTLQPLLDAITSPYTPNKNHHNYCQPPTDQERIDKTFCGT